MKTRQKKQFGHKFLATPKQVNGEMEDYRNINNFAA